MNLENLYLFKKVVEVGNITEASKQLHLSQPAISMQLKRLEEKMGVPLINSYPRGIKPTDAGMVLLHYCEKLKEVEEELWRSMEEFRDGSRGHIIIGAPFEIRTFLLPRMKAGFLARYPGIKVEDMTVEDADIERYVKKGIIDIGFTVEKEINHFESRITFYKNEAVFLVSSHNPVTRDTLYLSSQNGCSETVGTYKETIILESPELIKQAALAGLGDGILLECAIIPELQYNLLASKQIGWETISMITRPAEKIQESVRIFTSFVGDA